MKFKIIACINHSNTLGLNNKLLYNIKNDLINFKRMTVDNVVIMGRKTYESLPIKPLPHRINIVITSNLSFKDDKCIVVHSIDECIEKCKTIKDKEFYVIGGGSVYNEFISKDLIDTMYITEVDDSFEGDTFFPNVLMNSEWRKFYCSDTQYDRENMIKYFFSIYKKC